MIQWNAKLSNGEARSGLTDNGSWVYLASYLQKSKLKIIELYLSKDDKIGKIDNGCDGYFISNKLTASFPSNQQVNTVGIGYFRKADGVVRIKWYNMDLELHDNEVRKPENSGASLILN